MAILLNLVKSSGKASGCGVQVYEFETHAGNFFFTFIVCD